MKFVKEKDRPIIYLSGSFGTLNISEEEFLRRTQCKARCFSFAYTCPKAFYYQPRVAKALKDSLAVGCKIMMDSGAFSFHQFVKKSFGDLSSKKHKKGYKKYDHTDVDRLRDSTIDLYVDYCKRESKDWDFYANFDYIKHCPTIREMQLKLEKRGIRPTPVYHGDMSLDWLKRYCEDGHKFVCIGSTRRGNWKSFRYYYDQCFNLMEKYGVVAHGLAVTSLSQMFQYPWYSVDSATWVKVAAFGKIIYIDPIRNIIGQLHVSEKASTMKGSYNGLPESVQKLIRQQVEGYGYNFNKLSKSLAERCVYNAHLFSVHVHELKQAVSETKIRWRTLV